VRAIHTDPRRACRHISPDHVIVTPNGRIRIAWLGVTDVVAYESLHTLAAARRADVLTVGRTILSVACRHKVVTGKLDVIYDFSFVDIHISNAMYVVLSAYNCIAIHCKHHSLQENRCYICLYQVLVYCISLLKPIIAILLLLILLLNSYNTVINGLHQRQLQW
jgi:hypothetical protein